MSNSDPEQPDIIITEADLVEIDQQLKKTIDFFENPTPRPLAPVAMVETLCVQSRRKYIALFEQKTPASWKLVRFLDDSLTWSGQEPLGTQTQTDLVCGSIDWNVLTGGEVQCPYCHAKSMVKCGKCNHLSCHPDGKQGSPFQCPWCGSGGNLQGSIQTLNGTKGKSKL